FCFERGGRHNRKPTSLPVAAPFTAPSPTSSRASTFCYCPWAGVAVQDGRQAGLADAAYVERGADSAQRACPWASLRTDPIRHGCRPPAPFPKRVGMNRQGRRRGLQGSPVPHTRGDEPDKEQRQAANRDRSRHAWG